MSNNISTIGSGQPDPVPSLTKDHLLAALDAQIRFKMDERQSAGWTRWAIWGALATLTWLATDLFSHPGFSLKETTLLAIGFFGLCRLLEIVVAFFSPSSTAITAPTRFRIFADVIGSARLELVASGAGYLLIIIALAWFGFHHLLLVWIYVIGAFSFNIAIFAYGFLPLAFPTQFKRRMVVQNLPSFIAIAVLFGGLIQVGQELRQLTSGLNLSEVRLAIIFIASSYLFHWLASDATAAPLLEHLKQIRQDLAFGRISLVEAARHADVALSGLKLTEALHPPVSTALTKAEALQTVLVALKELTEEADKLVSTMREQVLEHDENEERGAQLMRLLDRLDAELRGVAVKKSELETAVSKLQISSQIIVMFSPESKQEIQSITEKVSAAIQEARKDEADFTKQIAALKSASNELTQKMAGLWNSYKAGATNETNRETK
jgi:hypothetical protein